MNVITIPLPPLRERRDDIPLLAEHFLQKYRSEFKGKVKLILPETMDLLMRYEWPGNVRELENVVERAIVIGKSDAILIDDLPLIMQEQKVVFQSEEILSEKTPLEQRVEDFEKKLIIDALRKTGWVQTKAAELLGTSRNIVKYKMKKYGIKKG